MGRVYGKWSAEVGFHEAATQRVAGVPFEAPQTFDVLHKNPSSTSDALHRGPISERRDWIESFACSALCMGESWSNCESKRATHEHRHRTSSDRNYLFRHRRVSRAR